MRSGLLTVGFLLALILLLLSLLPPPPREPPRPPGAPGNENPSAARPAVPPEEPGEVLVEPPPPASDAAIPPFRFLVLDIATGEPIEGAVVEPDPRPDPAEEPARLRVAPAPTGVDGRASFVLDHPGAGCAYIRAGKPGYQMVRRLVDRGEVTVIRLTAGAPVSGRVVRFRTGEGVEGAVVRAFTAGDVREVSRPASTDVEGEFTLDAVLPGEKIYFVADTPGFAPALVLTEIPMTGGRVEITVGGRGTLTGRVLDPAGNPAPGIEVWLMRPHVPLPPRAPGGHWLGGNDLEHLIRFLYPRQITDEGGGFRFVGVRLSSEQIAVAKLSEFAEAISEPFTFTTDGEELIRDIQLPAPASALLTVKDLSGAILPGVQIDFRSERVWFDARNAGIPLEDGSVLVTGIAPGHWELRAWLPGSGGVEQVMDLAPGERAEIEFRAPAGLRIEGQVVDPDGNPVPHADVTTRSPPWVSGETDQAGRFRLTGLPAESVAIEVSPGWTAFERSARPLAPARVEDVRPGGDPVRIVLPWGGFVTGRIPDGEPGSSLRIRVFSRKVSGRSSRDLAEDRRFRIIAPEPGLPFLVKIISNGRPPRYFEHGPLREAQDLDLGDITFEPGQRLAGRVVDPENNAVEGAEIKLIERWLDISARTDSGGGFRFDDMPSRPIWANVSAKGYPDHLVIFEPPGEGPEPVVRLSPGGLLKAEVRTAAGEPLEKGRCLIKWLVTHPLDAELDELGYYFDVRDGHFERSLQPGRYTVRVWDEDHEEKWEGEISISEGAVVEQRVDLRTD